MLKITSRSGRIIIAPLLSLLLTAGLAWADPEREKAVQKPRSSAAGELAQGAKGVKLPKKVYRKNKRIKPSISPVVNVTYWVECGACHMAYQPGLLPSQSWRRIIDGLEEHFGQNATMEPSEQAEIDKYLQENAADHTETRRSRWIVKSLKGETPLRVQEIPYIIRHHHELSKRVYKRKSIGSLGNCSACHQTADAAVYSERYVRIPK